jgi:serine/threonine-protein kinase
LLAVVRDVSRALDAAHTHGIVHGDLRASSVSLTNDSEGRPRATLMDFGSAELLVGRGPSKSGRVRKDQALHDPAGSDLDVCGDVRALGLLCFEALTGARFDATEDGVISDLRPELGRHFDEAVRFMIRAAPDVTASNAYERLLSAARSAGYEIAGTIPAAPRSSSEEITEHLPELATSPTSAPAGPAEHAPIGSIGPIPMQRSRGPLIVAAVAAIALLLVLLYRWW